MKKRSKLESLVEWLSIIALFLLIYFVETDAGWLLITGYVVVSFLILYFLSSFVGPTKPGSKINGAEVNHDLIISKRKNKPHTLSQDEIDARAQADNLHKLKLELKRRIFLLLEGFNFKAADELYIENKTFLEGYINEGRLDQLRAKLIRHYFSENFVEEKIMKYPPDFEQAEAIGALGQEVLVSARAGSGKTATISAKVAFLCKKYGYEAEEILVLCFNNSAAENMKKKIQGLIPGFVNARTFHSWANEIVSPPRNSILFDEKGDYEPKKYSNFVKEIITSVSLKNPNFKSEVYDFFRTEDEEIDESNSDTRYYEDENHRYTYLRNKSYITLSGVRVKSRGEKWIADFLFEHGIEFKYEKRFGWDKPPRLPDFTIKVGIETYVLEHWGINEFDKNQSVPLYWKKSWREYRKEMEEKRKYFSERTCFIETSIRDIDYDLPIKEQREKFEEKLKELLETKGIECNRLSKEDLVGMAWKKQLFSKLDTLMGQFIGWMQNFEWTDEDVQNHLYLNRGYSDRQMHFCEIGLIIYEEYRRKLKESGKIDFNILMTEATKKIREGDHDISRIRYLIVDEFQDFSKSFQNLVDAVTMKNPDIKLFFVGDSWQLINGFAGSDLKYFNQFKDKANLKVISTCYRSSEDVVENGNAFADCHEAVFEGKRSQCSNQVEKGHVSLYNIQDTRIENDKISRSKDEEYKEPYRISDGNTADFLPPDRDLLARYSKKCVEIIIANPNKTYLLLHRNRKMNGIDLEYEFKKNLEAILIKKGIKLPEHNDEEPPEEILRFKTMHSSKGLEADIVVLLDVCERIIPSIHPTNELFEIFGRTPKKILDEEKKLYYVAITRAKEKLYIITDDNPSDFIPDKKDKEDPSH